jgi:hypothetical protein
MAGLARDRNKDKVAPIDCARCLRFAKERSGGLAFVQPQYMDDGSLDLRPSVDGKCRDPRPDGRTVDRTDPLDFQRGTDRQAVTFVEDDFTGKPPDCRRERDDDDLRERRQGGRPAQ